MTHKFLICLISFIVSCPGLCEANPSALVTLDLTLAGYRLGMSHQEVAEVRPFHYQQSFKKSSDGTSTFYALADRVYIDGVIMNVQVSFKNEKADKIVARVSPESFENVLHSIQKTLGAGEDKSRVLRNYNNEDIRQTVYLWGFPAAEMHLIKVSPNTKFATISLRDK